MTEPQRNQQLISKFVTDYTHVVCMHRTRCTYVCICTITRQLICIFTVRPYLIAFVRHNISHRESELNTVCFDRGEQTFRMQRRLQVKSRVYKQVRLGELVKGKMNGDDLLWFLTQSRVFSDVDNRMHNIAWASFYTYRYIVLPMPRYVQCQIVTVWKMYCVKTQSR